MRPSLYFVVFSLGLASCSGGGGGTSGSVVPSTTNSTVTTQAAMPVSGAPSLKCFQQAGGTCTIKGDGSVTLTIPPASSGSFNADAGAGVYFSSENNLKGLTISQITALRFNLTGNYGAGTPRVVIPYQDGYVFVYPVPCGSSQTTLLGPIDAFGSNTTCVETSGPTYTSWQTFAAANGDKIITGVPFIVADTSNNIGTTVTVSNFTMSK